MKRARRFGPLILVAALAGCGGPATVSGKVTYLGRPVLSGSVVALNADGTAKLGVIQPDGTYTVEGVKRGRVRFGVFSPDPTKARSIVRPIPRPKRSRTRQETHRGGRALAPRPRGRHLLQSKF